MDSFVAKLKVLKQKANKLPQSPGVYIMKNSSGRIIYIGKAKALKNRVTQYFGTGNQHSPKVRSMVSNVDDFEYIVCDSEFEALILENSLIKQNQPKYNILLKDDKGYHYIKITNDKWRKIETSKTTDKNGDFIGPYNSGYIVKETVDEARKIFRLPDCNRSFDKPSKPCLNFHIGLCDAPCKGKIGIEEYNKTVDAAIDFIKHGGSGEYNIQNLTNEMLKASEEMNFEAAARLRDRIRAIEKINQRQKVVMTTYKTQDVIACAMMGELSCVEVLMFRDNRLTDKKHFFIDGFCDKKTIYSEFLPQYYQDKTDIPSRILIDNGIENAELIERWLCEKSGHKVQFIVPVQAEPKKLIDMCLNNAAENLSDKIQRTGRETTALNELADLLGLSSPPRYIEAYDISNTAGSENVAAMIVFKDGRPFKSSYRRFKIKTFVGQDDYRSMSEVLDRRFDEYKKGNDEAFSVLPDLILLDGGKGQISAVKPVLEKHNIDVALFGMVKDSKHRTRAITDSEDDITIKATKKAYTLITAIQDEVHRFAIGYHKNRRSKSMLNSELKKINGIGDAKAKILLKEFKTLSKIKTATIEELSNVKGIDGKLAKAIYDYFNS
ncbi:MAG: excinuclease ABC subunit UvrC [Clostridia bacterium]|nr:excinuclease ABC subunit UvrC [Clostridia bacterium]